ncbi:MAG: 4Fe-4S dicluster domain-containing protein [Nitrospinaceae bacterium]
MRIQEVTEISPPQRWNKPFGPDMTGPEVQRLLSVPEIAAIARENFPPDVPLEGILKNDTRIIRYKPGDIIIREGDYGNSAFLVLGGRLRVVLSPGLPSYLLGRKKSRKKSVWKALSQLWMNRKIPEIRDDHHYRNQALHRDGNDAVHTHVYLQDIPAVLNSNKTAVLESGALFGELAALGRIPRTATVFSETHSEVLEIRWQGLREFRKYDENWRRRIEKRYSESTLITYLRKTPLFQQLDDDALQDVSQNTLFKSYGTYDWTVSYKNLKSMGKSGIKHEPLIARQGDYPDDLIMVRAGFARVSVQKDDGPHTLTYLGAGNYYGIDELYRTWRGEKDVSLKVSITALGYVDILRVPAKFLEKYVFRQLDSSHPWLHKINGRPNKGRHGTDPFKQTMADESLLEWMVQERFINGTQTMLINLDRCVRCDDCVDACAAAHGGNPRFIRHGKTFGNWMVANACMQCVDPVCLIGCPTGAIHRTVPEGTVIINDDTCIGCETCANSCPYSNIRMVAIKDEKEKLLHDVETRKPILKATKCDLCVDQLSGPACVQACSHEALHRVDFRQVRPDGLLDH